MATKLTIGVDLPGAGLINDTLTTAKFIKRGAGKSSLTRMAKDTVMQFPLLISSSIDTDEITIISKSLERQFAALMVSSMSLDAGVNINKYGNLRNYLKKFHSNSDIPANIQAAPVINLVDGAATEALSAEVIEGDSGISGIGKACWDDVSDKLTMESVNDIYRPYDRTEYLLSSSISAIKAANESVVPIDAVNINGIAKKAKTETTVNGFGGIRSNTPQMKDKNMIVNSDKLSSLEPTLINCTFVMHGQGANATQWTQNVVLGIKSMIRVIRSDFMVNNMADAAKDSNIIFKFIKWTRGEYGLMDILFNKTENKDMATTSTNDSSHWWKALRRRKAINDITKLFEQGRVLPSTTIIITTSEVQQIATLTGVDLSKPYNALKLLNKYYLLGFGIYDTESTVLSMMFDGESTFSEISLNSLKNSIGKDNVSLMDSKAMRYSMGRV